MSSLVVKILIIEDEPELLEYLKILMQNWGYEFACAESGLEAQKQIVEYAPNLILLDIMLPDIDGITLLHRLKTNPKSSHIPVIMVTALRDASTIQDAYTYGASDYLPKPFEPDALKDKIEKISQPSPVKNI